MTGVRGCRIVALACSLALGGCATWGDGGSVGSSRSRGELVRPDAPADYDILVAQQLVLEGRGEEAVDAYLRAVEKDPDSAYLHRRAALALAQHNRLSEALVYAERAVELDPDDESSRLFLAQLHRLRRDPAAAEAVLVDTDSEPLSADAAFQLYQVHLELDDFDAAMADAKWLVENDPDDLRGLMALANVYQRMERPEDAERTLRDALKSDPGNLRLYSALARMLRQRGDFEGETRLYAEVLDLYPYHHATLVSLGEAQLALEDPAGAIRTFEMVEQRYPDDVDTAVRLGYLYFEAHRYDEAAERFERALVAQPEQHEVTFFLGVVHRRAGDSDAAERVFAQIPEDHRYYPDARAQIASILERRGDYPGALDQVERANAVRPSREFELYAATLRAKSGDLDAAVASMETLLEDEPESDDLLFNLGVVYGEAKRTDEAISYMQLALQKNPDNASALNYIGYTWAENGVNLDEAERLIRRAIELRPDDGYIVDSLGWVYYMRARPLVENGQSGEAQIYLDQALAELEKAQQLTGGDPVISEHLGDTYLLLDEKERALEQFEEAIRLEPREGEQPELFQKFETLHRELR